MAVLSVPKVDQVKVKMLERYLNIMCEQRKNLEVSAVSVSHSPQTKPKETWSGILKIEDYTIKQAIPTDFPRFSELPSKVRRRIWMFARPEARYIKIRESRWADALYSNAEIPAMLHTCKESRKVALKWYDLSFARDPAMGFWGKTKLKEIMENTLINPSNPMIYFDFEQDGLYSQCAYCYGHKMSCRHAPLSFDFLRVKRLAFEGPLSVKPFFKIALCFPNVETIMLIRGRSTVRRKAVSPSEFMPVSEKFEWEGEDLLVACLDTMQKMAPGCSAIESVKSVQRVTLADVQQTQVVDREGRSRWPCR